MPTTRRSSPTDPRTTATSSEPLVITGLGHQLNQLPVVSGSSLGSGIARPKTMRWMNLAFNGSILKLTRVI